MFKNLIYCPIDIEVDITKFTSLSGVPVFAYNPWWDSTSFSEDVAKKNNFSHILEQLPYDKIINMQHKVQHQKVDSHVDVFPQLSLPKEEYEHVLKTEPSGYRFVLKGKDDSLEVHDGKEWITTKLPAVPCVYVINSSSAQHRVKEDKMRTTIYVRGQINLDKHWELLDRSYKKYSDYAVFKKS